MSGPATPKGNTDIAITRQPRAMAMPTHGTGLLIGGAFPTSGGPPHSDTQRETPMAWLKLDYAWR